MEENNQVTSAADNTSNAATNVNGTNIEKVEINFEDLNRRINNFETIDKLKYLDISVENFDKLKEEIIDEEIAVLVAIGEDLHESKVQIEAEEKRLDQRTLDLPKEIEETRAREIQVKEELLKLEEEFAMLDGEDPDYANKEAVLKDKREELKEVSSTLNDLNNEQAFLKNDYEELNVKKTQYQDAKQDYDNRIDISFDVINKYNPEKAQEVSNMQKTEELVQNEPVNNDSIVNNGNNYNYANAKQQEEQEEVKENSETALTDPKKENKIKMFFIKIKEKIQNIANKFKGKNVPEQEIQELANEIEVQAIDEGAEFREQCAMGARNLDDPEQLREIIESEEIRNIKEAPSKQEQAIGAI